MGFLEEDDLAAKVEADVDVAGVLCNECDECDDTSATEKYKEES